jgi:dUTP pyrophosphatase
MELQIQRLRPAAKLPVRATTGSTGFDVHACLDAPLTLTQHPQRVPTGIAIAFPHGFDAQVRPRSGLSSRGIGVAFGTVDADYRGELLVTMWTFGDTASYELHHHDRIAQLVFAVLAPVEVVESEALPVTSRGDGGHGSTGR